VRERGAVVELDQRVNDRLRVHDNVDPVERHPEQVHRLDHLEALVHQGGRVDRDLAAHVPGRVSERLLPRDVLEVGGGAAAERPPAGGEHEAVDGAGAALGVHELEEGGVLGVDGDHLRAGGLGQRHHELAAHYERLLVGEGEVDPLAERGHAGPEPGRAHERVQHEVGVAVHDQLDEPLVAGEHLAPAPRPRGARGGVLVGERYPGDAVLLGLRDQPLEARLRGERDDLDLPRSLDHVERLPSDRAGGAE
jgi:hypothetical protein